MLYTLGLEIYPSGDYIDAFIPTLDDDEFLTVEEYLLPDSALARVSFCPSKPGYAYASSGPQVLSKTAASMGVRFAVKEKVISGLVLSLNKHVYLNDASSKNHEGIKGL